MSAIQEWLLKFSLAENPEKVPYLGGPSFVQRGGMLVTKALSLGPGVTLGI